MSYPMVPRLFRCFPHPKSTNGGSASASSQLTAASLLTVTGVFTLLAGIGASLFHLGRPFQAWKAFLGFRTSWLSREIVMFGVYAFACLVWNVWFLRAALGCFTAVDHAMLTTLIVLGAVAVYCSIMVYVDTRRAFWRWALTAPKFAGTAILLGLGAGFLFVIEMR